MAPHTAARQQPLPSSLFRKVERWLRLYPAGTLALWGLTLYVAAVSLATFWQALAFRMAGGAIAGGGNEGDPLYELGTSLGFWGVIYFGMNFILATRWRWVEALFGGLDQVYQAHNLAGRLAMTLLVLHGGIDGGIRPAAVAAVSVELRRQAGEVTQRARCAPSA